MKEMLNKFDPKAKQNISGLMGKETSIEIITMLNNIEIASSQIIQHSKIVSVNIDKVKSHLQNLKDCHQRVFTGLSKSLFDYNRIKDEFKIVLMYQSQYQYHSSPSHHQYPQQSSQHYSPLYQSAVQQQSHDYQRNQMYQSSSQLNNQPNFQIIKKKIVDALPALQDCMIFFLNDFEKTYTKDIGSVREGMNKVVLSIEKSCKDLVNSVEKEEQYKKNLPANASPNMVAYQTNFIKKVNDNLITSFVQQMVQNDEGFRLLYSDLSQDIKNLSVDFTREVHFNHNQINSLKAPTKSNQINVLTRRESLFVEDEEESFMSFHSHSEEEKTTKNDYNEEFKDQTYSHNQSDIIKSPFKNGNLTFNNNGESDGLQESIQISKQESKSKATKQELMEHEQFIKKRITWMQGEELKHHFSCALAQNINLQGRIYITNERFIFQSYFNGNTIFFNETILEIPKNDILYIHKKKNMLSFDNAIQIDVIKGSLLFTQFIYRDDAYNAILNVLQPINMVSSANSFRGSQKQEDRKSIYTANRSQKSLTSIQEEQPGDKQQQQINQQTILKGENITVRDIFQSCLGDFQYKHQQTNQQFENFFYYYIEHVMKCWNIQIDKWSPPPPHYFLDQSSPYSEDQAKKKEKIQDWIEISSRQVTYDKAIPLSGMPFLPKSCKVSEKQKIIFISPDELIFELEAYSSGAPMTDSFYHFIRSRFVQLTPDTVSYKIQMDVRFLKSNWFSGTIESQSQKEGIKSSQEIEECFQKRITSFLQDKNERRRNTQTDLNSAEDIESKSILGHLNGKSHAQSLASKVTERSSQIQNSIEPFDKYKHEIIDVKFTDPVNPLSVHEVFKIIFGDMDQYEGYSDLYECLKIKKFKDKNYSAAKFSPPFPQYIYDNSISVEDKQKHLQHVLEAPHFSEREIKFTHPLPPSSIPFMPKDCQVKEVVRAYFVSDSELILNIEAFTSGIPKGDSFTVRVRYMFTQVDPHTVVLKQKTYLHFKESTFLQSQIENATIEQQKISAQIIKPFFEEVVAQYISKKQQIPQRSNQKHHSSTSFKNSHRSQENKAAVENRKRRILSTIEPLEKYKHKLIDYTFNYNNQPLNLQKVCNFFFSDTQPYNEYKDFFEFLKRGKIGDYDYSSTLFSPPIPSFFSGHNKHSDEELIASPDYSEREIKLTHPLPPSNIPFMPKFCNIREVTKVYWVSNDMIVVNLEAFTKGIPKGDSFSVRVRSVFQQVDEHNISFKQYSYVHFFESTFLAGKIESGTIEQSQLAVENYVLPAYKEAFVRYMKEGSSQQFDNGYLNGVNIENNRQIQYDSYRIKSIQITDDMIDSQTDITDLGSIKQRSPKFHRHSSLSQRNISKNSTPHQQEQSQQIQQLNQNITQMNDRIKFLIAGFAVVYISTLVFMFLMK